MKRAPALPLAAVCLLATLPARAQAPALEVAQASPRGEVDSLAEAGEVRIVFSEPMVALGRVPAEVAAPFFHISPVLPGSFRWSGTRTLVFTPDPARLPYGTRYDVTIGAGATSATGRRLERPYTFSFTTPTVRLLQTSWARRDGRHDLSVLLFLRFNQPVSHALLGPHVSAAFQPHAFTPPLGPGDDRAPADPAAVQAFQAKAAEARNSAALSGPVALLPAPDWDKEAFPPADDLLVFETAIAPPAEAWLRLSIGAGARGVSGGATPGRTQDYTVQLAPAFFVDGFRCRRGCDPESYNPLVLRGRVAVRALRGQVSARDVTPPTGPVPLVRAEGREDEEALDHRYEYDHTSSVTLHDVGLETRPARTYVVVVGEAATAADGQRLGYTWTGTLENWHKRAFTSFGAGHGVWEASGGSRLPFYSRNLATVSQWLAPLKVDDLMPAVRALQEKRFALGPPVEPLTRRLTPRPDAIQSFGIDLRPALSSTGTGLAWAALKPGQVLPRTPQEKDPPVRSSVVQVTNLGLTVKDSPVNTVVLVTRLDSGDPVEGARVSIRTLDNAVFWSGFTGADGLALAPRTALRDPERVWELRFLVTAEKDGDVAYVGNDWTEGIEPWSFGLRVDLGEARPLLRGTLFPDRGVYRLGEEVHVKAILRSDTAQGIRLLDRGTALDVVVRDSQGEERDKRSVPLSEWSSADWAFRLPSDAPLGHYSLTATVAGQQGSASGSFLVAAYRRPDFRVDANLAGESSVAGVTLKGVIEARYLFGAPMAGRDVRWTSTRSAAQSVPDAIGERYPLDRYTFLDEEREDRGRGGPERLVSREVKLDAQGRLEVDVETLLTAGIPFHYSVEGEVTDVSRQTIAGRASFRVDPAPWYVGLRRPPYFASAERGVDTEVLAADLSGTPVASVPVTMVLTQVQWHAVRRAEGQGFYTWETERKEVEAGRWEVVTASTPVPLHVPVPSGGYFVLRATAKDAAGRSTTASTSFYVLGAGYTAWERYDHNRIDLVPEKRTYRPGETARLMVKSPWENALALLTTEREGVRTYRTFRLASTQETVSVPIGEEDVPNLYVSVVLVKGRTGAYSADDTGDPGRPAFRVGYAEIDVEDAAKRLHVTVAADAEQYRPATRARVDVTVKDAQGRAAPSEVTLWAVDHGVLSLTAYRTPDVLGTVWVDKALQVLTEDSRQNVISRRVLVSKGGDEGGGGGAADGPGTEVRKDFRVLAFWLGSLVTDAAGRGTTEVTLPESLTTYRIMAVAADKASRFGGGEREIRTSKPLLLRSAFPRFLARGDSARFGAVLHSQLADAGTAIVTMRSLDPRILEVTGEARRSVPITSGGTEEVRFDLRARAVGRARLQMMARLHGETDAFEEVLPVQVLVPPEVVAAHGQAAPDARERLVVPAGVVPDFGRLSVDTASTALVGLGEGARYLIEYPYGCAEQRASTALVLALAGDLGAAFALPGLDPAKVRETAAATLAELEAFQCPDGGFAFWKGECRSASPYVTSYVTHVLQRGRALGHAVTPAVLQRAHTYLEGKLAGERPANESWWPAYTAWQAFAVKVLAEGGRAPDSHVTRLYGFLDRMPVFALSYLLDAMTAAGEQGPRPAELQRRIGNAVSVEGGSAHVEELADPYLLWYWNSNVRSTAVVLDTLVRRRPDDPLVPGLVRWLLAVRKKGRWGNTQENGVALEALVDYYRKAEAEVPDFTAVVALGGEALLKAEFRGRSTVARSAEAPMAKLAGKGGSDRPLDLTFRRDGVGTLFYTARLEYALDRPAPEALDQGFRIERRYGAATAAGQAADLDPGAPAPTSFKAGDLVRVTLTLRLTKERRYVAVRDPLPAGFEPVESWFATTSSDLARAQDEQDTSEDDWAFWRRGGFDRVERHDDRVHLFATRLSEGEHTFTYVVRATTAGTFRTAPAHVEEMYEPEVFGRTPSAVTAVRP
ncbi:MAG TPA: MG2 domain-containing protein [Vicinamibacteria bacterium]|nr:MG2 domain-containing protein [Vicinamibacteria bacterium]